ncbi:hypothetical protein Rhopal_001719-T1 [Rhodotorula paludigena]|uniref:Uncharacterized protein n=1 Tax=Rhodotorula paludigena TaxID=86838 RepID=A0AAV5GGR7_9BASI|nr:hypothetical protein Rhopal_001719-T1 [Rhodotorula paludigena]
MDRPPPAKRARVNSDLSASGGASTLLAAATDPALPQSAKQREWEGQLLGEIVPVDLNNVLRLINELATTNDGRGDLAYRNLATKAQCIKLRKDALQLLARLTRPFILSGSTATRVAGTLRGSSTSSSTDELYHLDHTRFQSVVPWGQKLYNPLSRMQARAAAMVSAEDEWRKRHPAQHGPDVAFPTQTLWATAHLIRAAFYAYIVKRHFKGSEPDHVGVYTHNLDSLYTSPELAQFRKNWLEELAPMKPLLAKLRVRDSAATGRLLIPIKSSFDLLKYKEQASAWEALFDGWNTPLQSGLGPKLISSATEIFPQRLLQTPKEAIITLASLRRTALSMPINQALLEQILVERNLRRAAGREQQLDYANVGAHLGMGKSALLGLAVNDLASQVACYVIETCEEANKALWASLDVEDEADLDRYLADVFEFAVVSRSNKAKNKMDKWTHESKHLLEQQAYYEPGTSGVLLQDKTIMVDEALKQVVVLLKAAFVDLAKSGLMTQQQLAALLLLRIDFPTSDDFGIRFAAAAFTRLLMRQLPLHEVVPHSDHVSTQARLHAHRAVLDKLLIPLLRTFLSAALIALSPALPGLSGRREPATAL